MNTLEIAELLVNSTTDYLILDYRDLGQEAVNSIRKVLKTFGLHMYSDPGSAGSDTWVFLVIDRKLEPKEVRAIFKTIQNG